MKYQLIEATSVEQYDLAVDLFKEYALDIGIDLSFQNFDQEIKEIKQQYSRPEGILMIVEDKNDRPLGCYGIRKLSDSICELKRMYL